MTTTMMMKMEVEVVMMKRTEMVIHAVPLTWMPYMEEKTTKGKKKMMKSLVKSLCSKSCDVTST